MIAIRCRSRQIKAGERFELSLRKIGCLKLSFEKGRCPGVS
jgi:hypothetical protein